MSRSATARSVRQAGRMIKRLMNFYPEGWEGPQEAGRQAMRRFIEELMNQRRAGYLEEELARGQHDRCNGHYSRHVLTALGDIELSVPRTRTWSAVGVVEAVHWMGPELLDARVNCRLRMCLCP